MDQPKPELNLHLTPESLRGNSTFQDSWRTSKPYLQDVLLWLQRRKATELKDDKEELGRQIIIINDIMNILEECTGSNNHGQGQKVIRKKLNNR